jgi:hypothetical protein
MNCKKTRRLLPLLAGSDLPQSRISAVKAHLEKCRKCRIEYDAYLLTLEKTKEWLEEVRQDWNEREWQEAVRRATEKKEQKVFSLAPWPFKKAWAYAMMAVFAFLLSLFVIRPSFIKQKMEAETGAIAGLRQEPERVKEESRQDVISMTLVSHETGLRIVWFFNKNFELEVKE